MLKKTSRFLIAIVLAAFLLRVFRIGHESLWVDEILTLGKSVPKSGLGIWDYLKYNIQGPFHSLVVYLFHFVSANDGWLRLPSAIAGTASVYYFYRWVECWLGERVARLSAVLLVVNPLHIYYSQEVRNYGFLFFFVTFSSYYLHRLLVSEKGTTWMSYTVGIALAALSNFSAASLYAVHSVMYVVRRGFSGRRFLCWVVVSLVILVLISPWVYRIYVIIDVPALVTPVTPGELADTERLRGGTTITPGAVPYAFYAFSVGFTMGPSLRDMHTHTTLSSVLGDYWPWIVWVGLLFGIVSVVGFWGLVKSNRPWKQVALYLVLPFLFVLALCWQNAKAFNVRYVLVSLPAYLCVVAYGLQSMGSVWRRVFTVLVFGTLFVSLGNYYFNGRYAKEDVRGAARYLDEHAKKNDCILVPTVTGVFRYYFEGASPLYTIWAPPGTPRSRIDKQLDKIAAECRTVWYVNAREWVHDPDGYVSDVLDSRYRVTQEIDDFDGVSLKKFER